MRDTEREREVATANAFAYLVWCLGLGLNALGPVHWRLVRCCKPEFLSNDICISSTYLFLSVWSYQPTCLIKIFVMPVCEQVYLHSVVVFHLLPFDEFAIKYYAASVESSGELASHLIRYY